MAPPSRKQCEQAVRQLEILASTGELECLFNGFFTDDQIKQLASDNQAESDLSDAEMAEFDQETV